MFYGIKNDRKSYEWIKRLQSVVPDQAEEKEEGQRISLKDRRAFSKEKDMWWLFEDS